MSPRTMKQMRTVGSSRLFANPAYRSWQASVFPTTIAAEDKQGILPHLAREKGPGG
jgi:hypothetical protein